MRRFKNILLIYECDKSTLDRAAALAEENGARLTVVQVVKDIPEGWHQLHLDKTSINLQELVLKDCEVRLKKLVAPLERDGLRVSTKVLVGAPFIEIIREVIGGKRDLVIMTAEGKGGLRERLFGSTSLHLMRKCPCPVWIMKPTRRRRFLRILAAVDPNPTDTVRDSLNATILQLASSLAAQDSAELHIAHAWTLFGEGLLAGRAGVSESEINQYSRQEEDKHQDMLNALIAKHTDGTAKVHIKKGLADSVILEIAKSKKIALLVMGTVCRTGISGFFIGNTAEKVLDEVDCSVLTVKPQGFVSPVKLT